ncbi:iron ABC transporter permease, partial [Mesorhizobium sp. M2C.T.Ca.TU.002.02.1.1]
MALGAILLVALALLSIAYGSTLIPLREVVGALAHAAGLDSQSPSGPGGSIVVD